MTNYINEIEWQGDRYAVGPYRVIGFNNIVNRFTNIPGESITGFNNVIFNGNIIPTGSSNIIIGTPTSDATFDSISGNENILLSNSYTSLLVSSSGVTIGGHVEVTSSKAKLGDFYVYYDVPDIQLTHSSPSTMYNVTIPCDIYLLGHSRFIRNGLESVSYTGTSTRVYYKDNSVICDGPAIVTIDGQSFNGYSTGGIGFGFSYFNSALHIAFAGWNTSSSNIYYSGIVDAITVSGLGI